MLFTWWRQRRRRKILEQPFPTDWLRGLEQNVAHYRLLSDADRVMLRDRLRIFIAEKNWEGCGGLQLTEEMQITIAAQACLMTLHLDEDLFDHVQSILVYPRDFVAPDRAVPAAGLVLEEDTALLGEAHYRGPVVLSWQEVLAGAREPGAGQNLVFHEFAHQLDMLDGVLDGTPPLETRAQAQRWHRIMTTEFNRLIHASAHGRATLLDDYGATDEAEFFAVASECFFDQPVEMARRHPELYALLRDYYKQDPASRFAASG
jgi:Mlc titration factor MtfA (ptsG expression regulator)